LALVFKSDELLHKSYQLYQGCGLPTQKTHKRFNPNQKNYMIDAFNHGEQTGFKMNSSTVALVSKPIFGK